MEDFYLTSVSIPLLAKFLLSFIITFYILIYIPKNREVKWFSTYLIGYTLLDLFAFLGQTINSELALLSLPLQYLSSLVLSFSYLQFAYLFKANYFEKEHKAVFYLFGSIGLICFLSIIYVIATLGVADYSQITSFAAYPLICIFWSIVVYYRKYRIALCANESFKNGFLAFFILSLLALCISFSVIFETLGLITPTQNMVIFFVFNLIIISLVTINFINYLAKKTTVLVKLVGLSLVLFITVIGLQGLLVIPNFEEAKNSGLYQSEQVLQDLHNQAEPYAWFLLGSIFLIVAIFPLFYYKSILSPLKTLLNGVDELNKGNLNVNIPVTYQDEIGSVTRHFNNMAENLRKANDELKEYAQDLEAKVTDRTEKLNKKTKLLEQQTQQLAEMEEFRSKLFMDISHELRTPITLISGPLQTLISQKNLDENTKNQLAMSLRNSDRLKALVEQIIDLNRLESNQLVLRTSNVDVCEQLKIIVNSFESLMTFKKHNFEYSIPKNPIELYLDVDKFEKIITNLISNASKFTPKNGSISITLTDTDNKVIIKVMDTGIGIEPDKLSTIFDRYQTSASTKDEYKQGLGVGLAITKEYVTLHGGKISVESTKGIGSTFTITLKKGSQHISDLQIEEQPTFFINNTAKDSNSFLKEPEFKLSENTAKETILVVEDNEDMATYICKILKAEGYNILQAEHGKIALEILRTSTPDLIISDIMMPVMDGMEFLEKLKQSDNYKLTPTIFLSARSDLNGRLQSFNLGVNDYLIKPFNVDELRCRIANLLEFSKARKGTFIELSEETSTSVDQALINSLTELVEKQMHDSNFNMDKLASELSMSRSTLYREVKKATGFTAASFVKEIRLQKARQKLEVGVVKNISELSYEIGFSTPSYFSKMYKSRFGKAPSDYLI